MNKNDNNLIVFVMYYSLFHKQLIDNQEDIINFPKNVFGIFSTVRRARKINSFPIDIHGCIGYWDINFNNLKKSEIYKNLLRVAYDSVWKDSRKKNFPSIETEPETMLELDFMLNPIYKIDKNSGIIIKLNKEFTNKDFGIIIQTMDKSQKATYLPHVFSNISWKDIVLSLKKKANITSNNFELFAYKITQIKSKFIDILTDNFFSYISIFNFSRLLIDNMDLKLKFPFIYSCKNNTLEWNNNDDVRNIATLSEIFNYINLYPKIATKKEFNDIKNKILHILKNIDEYNSQSLSFLGYTYPLLNKNKESFCRKLLDKLPSAENEFEKPEIIIGLNNAECNLNPKEYSDSLTYNSNDSIFKMNWIIQSIISFNKKPSNGLISILEKKIGNILKKKKQIETNYLAVAFEALCFTYANAGNNNKTLSNKMFELLFELEQRKNCYNKLYAFLNKTSRVDITGHMINGLVQITL